jgi:hypothetical protein
LEYREIPESLAFMPGSNSTSSLRAALKSNKTLAVSGKGLA